MPDPDLSARNHLQLTGPGGPLASIYTDTKQCSDSIIFLLSDTDRVLDTMCDGFNIELEQLAERLHLRVTYLRDSAFIWRKGYRRDLSPGAIPAGSPYKYRIVIARRASFERSYSSSRVPTGYFGAAVFVYRNRDE